MSLHRRLYEALLCATLVVAGLPAHAENYPTKPIRLIVGFAPGGSNDIVARIVGQKLYGILGVSVIVDNRPGANSMIGTQIAARSDPDGYTLTMISASAATNPSVYSDVPYDIEKDFSPVTVVASGDFILVVNPSVPARSVKELIAYAKQNPGKLNFASSGVGGTLHLAGELFKSLAHIDMRHVPYKGGAPALNDVISGNVQLMFAPLAVAVPQMKAGRVRALGVTGAKRWPALPEVPTIAEAGVPGYEATGWYGIVAPARTPRDRIATLNQAVVKALAQPDVKQQFAKMDLEPVGDSPEEMRKLLKTELVKWAKVVHEAHLKRGKVF